FHSGPRGDEAGRHEGHPCFRVHGLRIIQSPGCRPIGIPIGGLLRPFSEKGEPLFFASVKDRVLASLKSVSSNICQVRGKADTDQAPPLLRYVDKSPGASPFSMVSLLMPSKSFVFAVTGVYPFARA
ncbi:MAG: hypothetical protein J6S60_11080, partial [Oscillospiraceae bacterium]|nr:hypothetical protein [Oscillospiraceae bacterium]